MKNNCEKCNKQTQNLIGVRKLRKVDYKEDKDLHFWFYICRDCYYQETKDIDSLRLDWYIDNYENQDNIYLGVINKKNIVLATINKETLLGTLPLKEKMLLKENALNEVKILLDLREWAKNE